MEFKVERLKDSRITVTVSVTPEETKLAEEKALRALASRVNIKGFRAGHAPAEKVKERVDASALLEEAVRSVLPEAMKGAMEKSQAKPIIRPNVSLKKASPLEINITFVERPEVQLKKPNSITVEKRNTTVASGDIDDFVRKLLLQDRTETPVERAAKDGDSVKLVLTAVDAEGKEVQELTVPRYSVLLGQEELLPELQDHARSMKKGEKKTVTVSFPKDHDIHGIRDKKVTITMEASSVDEVVVPALTAEYLEKRLKTPKAPEDFKKDVGSMLTQQREASEMKRREEELYDLVRKATTVKLPPELIDAELMSMVEDLQNRVKQAGQTMESWMKSTGKEWAAIVKEMREIAEGRIVLRYGMEALAKAKNIMVKPEEVQAIIAEMPESTRDVPDEERRPGGGLFASVEFDEMMRKTVEAMVK